MEVNKKKNIHLHRFPLKHYFGLPFGKWKGLLSKIQGYLEILGIQGEGNTAFMVIYAFRFLAGNSFAL